MTRFTTTEEAIEYINAYSGKAEEFELPIAESLLDPMGMNMAIITDSILAKDFEPVGFVQEDGYRVFRFKVLD